MKKSLIVSLLSLGLMAVGCSNNKAATPDNSSSAQPAASSDNSSAANTSSSNSTNSTNSTSSTNSTNSGSSAAKTSDNNPDQHFIMEAAKGNRAEVQLGKMMVDK